jgi:hypothetical protein
MMSKIKKIIFHSSIMIFFFTWGMFALHYKIFPYDIIIIVKKNTYDKIYKTEKLPPPLIDYPPLYIEIYNKETNIFSDKAYYNHRNDEKLLNFYIIKNLRHSIKDIRINFLNDVEIYRAICKMNDNSMYSDWEIADFTVAIVGSWDSCVHNKIVKKKFKKGEVILKSGGPQSSDPIFILGNLDIHKTKIY